MNVDAIKKGIMMKIFGISFFEKKERSLELEIINFIEELSTEELIFLFKNNLNFYKIKENISIKEFKNKLLNKELKEFFLKYENVKIGLYEFSYKFFEDFPIEQEIFSIGKYNGIVDMVVFQDSNLAGYADDPETFNKKEGFRIYFYLIEELVSQKYKDIDNIEKIKELIYNEIKNFNP